MISFVQKLKKMDSQWLPHRAMEATKGKGWFKEALGCLDRWCIDSHDLPYRKEGIRDLVQQKFLDAMWKGCHRKMDYYQREINPMLTYNEQQYLRENISMRKRRLICRLRASSHDLEIETGRSKNIARQDSICKSCKSNEIEDDHVIWSA